MATTLFYPLAEKAALQKQFVGKSLKDVATPAAVFDVTKIRNNCVRMLDAVERLEFGWRAHIKTHKTNELTRLQVGEHGPVNIIVSTIAEAEHITPLLLEYKATGRAVNMLYAFPITPAAVLRLSDINKALGTKGLSLMIDNAAQLSSIKAIHSISGIPPQVFIKIDMGAKRAGVPPQTRESAHLIASILSLEATSDCELLGLYAHAGQSYSSQNPTTSLDYLRQEFEALLVTATSIHDISPGHSLVLSVGATPTTTSVRNLIVEDPAASEEELKAIAALKATIAEIRLQGSSIEVHAGVYPVLDLQQLATHALPQSLLAWDDLALTVIAEIASVYPGRGQNGSSEALVGSGTLALGREPCKAYSGWGILTPWNRPGAPMPMTGPEDHVGWQVGRISQEHGILVWGGDDGGSGSMAGGGRK